jgi:Zn-dependent protease
VNIIIAVAVALLFRFNLLTNPALVQIGAILIMANLVLAIINLIPIPPLDGSKILRALLPAGAGIAYSRLENLTYALGPIGLIGVLLILVFVFSDFVFALVRTLFTLLTGLSL